VPDERWKPLPAESLDAAIQRARTALRFAADSEAARLACAILAVLLDVRPERVRDVVGNVRRTRRRAAKAT
jgi:hypothetical protein